MGKHPRVRGEDQEKKMSNSTLEETPPRARGRLKIGIIQADGTRNTPACAGKTF